MPPPMSSTYAPPLRWAEREPWRAEVAQLGPLTIPREELRAECRAPSAESRGLPMNRGLWGCPTSPPGLHLAQLQGVGEKGAGILPVSQQEWPQHPNPTWTWQEMNHWLGWCRHWVHP